MRRGSIAAIVIALSLGAAFTIWIGHNRRQQVSVVSSAQIERELAAEEAIATDQGLVLVEEGATEDVVLLRNVPVAAGECLAVVAGIEGADLLSLAVMLDGHRAQGEAAVVHVATCARTAGMAALGLSRIALALPFPITQRTHFAILRGHVRSPRTYARLAYDATQRAQFDADSVRARSLALAEVQAHIGEMLTSDHEHAVLFPPTRASFAALRALSGRADLVPRVLPSQSGADPFAASTDVPTPPRVFTTTGQERVLAVVDAGALGSPCVSIVFANLADPETAVAIHRQSVPPDGSVGAIEALDAAISIDRICPAQGLFVYTVDPSSGGEYDVSVAQLAAEIALTPTPSHFGDEITGRRPSNGLVVLPVPFVDTLRASCATGTAASCFVLAALASEGILGAGTVREALEPLCTRTGGEACDTLAGALETTMPEAADAFERRACVTHASGACMRRGARYLDDASDLARAYQTFRYGCAGGSADCCRAASTMTEWHLAPFDAPAAEPTEPG